MNRREASPGPALRDLPRGTVVFLFTDIEGSTALWERDRQGMATVVDRHISLLHEAIERHGGVHFKTVGDALQAAFHTASDALAAAIAGQRAIIAEPWPAATGSLRVRMAIHMGTAEPLDGDYLAPALNRLSRLLAAGHGGQILVSEAVRRLVANGLPIGATLTSLGVHALRDLHDDEEVFQVVAPGLPESFPALRSLPHHPTNLSVPIAPLIGRDNDLDAVAGYFRAEHARLVTLTGPGGSGKTRLALAIASELLDAYPDGVFFVDLSSLLDPTLVLQTIVSVLKVSGSPDQSPRDILAAYLAAKAMLIVLDNFEQVLTAGADIAALLAVCPRLVILATSREPLRVRAELEYPLSPLAMPDEARRDLADLAQIPAVALFVARAAAVSPQFALTAENAAAVAAICRRLDGLPLAIELAAAWVRILPPRELLARLERRLPLLTGGARDLPTRQQTMRNAIAWSYDLLDVGEQTLFQFLSVFPRGFTLDAAEWVTADAPDVTALSPEASLGGGEAAAPADLPNFGASPPLDTLSLLASLVAKSLVVGEGETRGEPRFVMLGTIREFGREMLAQSGREALARQRHALWALALAERAGPHVTGPDASVWLESLEQDHASLRAALSWLSERGDGERMARLAGALGQFWAEHAHYSEGLRWLKVALSLGQGAPAHVRREVLTGAEVLAWYQGDRAYSLQLNEQALALAQEIGDRKAEAFELNSLGAHFSERGDSVRAAELFEASQVAALEVGDPEPAVLALHNLAHQDWQLGDPAMAISRLREALSLAREHQMGFILPSILVGLGTICMERGDSAQAGEYLQESIDLAQARGNLGDVITSIGGLAQLAVQTGHPKEATRLLGAANSIQEDLAIPSPPNEVTELAAIATGLREELGEDRFSSIWSEGRALSAAEAIALARSVQLEPAAHVPPREPPHSPSAQSP